jgi:hypothetical protein
LDAPLGQPLEKVLAAGADSRALDIECIASHGVFTRNGANFRLTTEKKAATVFLLEFIARLQDLGTVPMIDVRAYARWLER